MDLSQIHRILKAANRVQSVRSGYEKGKKMFSANAAQTNTVLDTADLVRRVRDGHVRLDDLRSGAAIAVDYIPRVYRNVAEHIQKQKTARTDAKT